eukprot:365973-Chlamydomonas_euryale.AAC.14
MCSCPGHTRQLLRCEVLPRPQRQQRRRATYIVRTRVVACSRRYRQARRRARLALSHAAGAAAAATTAPAGPIHAATTHATAAAACLHRRPRRRVVWCSASQPSSALALRYQQIVAHAISRTDALVHQRPCIYLQMDDGEADRPATADTEAEPAELEPEIRLVPEDISKREEP